MSELPASDLLHLPATVASYSIAAEPASGQLVIRHPCPRGSDDEIIVCGRRQESPYRIGTNIEALEAAGDADLPVGIELGENLRLGVEPFQQLMPDGQLSQGARIRLRFRF